MNGINHVCKVNKHNFTYLEEKNAKQTLPFLQFSHVALQPGQKLDILCACNILFNTSHLVGSRLPIKSRPVVDHQENLKLKKSVRVSLRSNAIVIIVVIIAITTSILVYTKRVRLSHVCHNHFELRSGLAKSAYQFDYSEDSTIDIHMEYAISLEHFSIEVNVNLLHYLFMSRCWSLHFVPTNYVRPRIYDESWIFNHLLRCSLHLLNRTIFHSWLSLVHCQLVFKEPMRNQELYTRATHLSTQTEEHGAIKF